MSLISTSEINKLICFQQSLEKSLLLIIEHLKKYSNYEDIFKIVLTQDQERAKEINQLKCSINDLITNITSKTNFLRDNISIENADIKQFKTEMILIQEYIQNLTKNAKTKLKALLIDYTDISEDVDYYNEKVFEWSQPVNLSNPYLKADYKPPHSTVKCVEMREFINFIHKSGGHENGWDKNDHQLYLKFRKKYKDFEIMAKKLHEILPDKDMSEIKEHEEWYKKYIVLKMNKKDAIKKWNDSKNKPRMDALMITGENNVHTKVFTTNDDLKEKLIKWKIEKEMKFQINMSAEEINQNRIRELDYLRKKKNAEIKKIVEDWKKTKIYLEQEQLMRRKIQEETERKRKSAEANKLIKQFQTRDDFYILKIKQQKKALQNHKPERSKSSQLAARDPERVLKPTQQWINRVHDEKFYMTETVMPLKKLPKLGVPEWRRNLK